MWDKNDSSLRPLHLREIVWMSTTGAPGSHKSSVHYEQGGRTSAVQSYRWEWSSCPSVLELSDLWAIGSSIFLQMNLRSPVWLRFTDKNFLQRGQKIDKEFYLTPGAKVWLAAFLPQGGRTLQQRWPSKSWARDDGWVWDAPTWVSSRSTHHTCACCATMCGADVAAAPQIFAFVQYDA